MSQRQLRSKRKTNSPVNPNVQAKTVVPLIKKPKTAAKVDVSDSESSSDEFVRPSKDLKVSTGILLSRNGPSPVPDFSSIEKSIFAGVSTLSDSDSDSSDFEEVPVAASPRVSKKDDSGILSKENGQMNNVKSNVPNPVKDDVATKPVRNLKKEPTLKDKDAAAKSKVEKLPPRRPVDVPETTTDGKNTGRGSRAAKRKNAEESEDTAVSPGKQIKNEDEPEKTSPKRSSRSRLSTRKAKVQEEETKSRGRRPGGKGKVTGNSEAKEEVKVEDEENRSRRSGPGRNGKAAGKNEVKEEKFEEEVKKPKRSGPGRNAKATKSEVKKEKSEKQVAIKEEVPANVDNLNVAQLLALGEGLKLESKSDSESDEWEEVDPNEVKKHEIPKEGVQITLDAPEFSWRRKKQQDRQACLQAEMNRAFNRVRRELQLLCHKASLLLWVAHGIYLNKAISNQNVIGMALSLVPPDLCEVPNKPGRKYITKMLHWFATHFECAEGFPEETGMSKSRQLSAVLEQNFSRKYAKSTKEMTFMFVAMLRAVGIEARLVISFQPVALKPQSDELLSINSKKKGRTSKKETKESSEAEDDPAPQTSQTTVTSPYFKGKEKTPAPKLTGKSKTKSDSGKESEALDKAGPSSKPSSSAGKGNDSKKKGRKPNSKSDATAEKSPTKSRDLRRKTSRKSYVEKTDSENEDSDEEETKPILSPDRKKGDKNLSERLKAAAAKRIPTNRRFSAKASVQKTTKRKSQDSDSDFEPEPKEDSGVESSRSTASPVKKTTPRRSQSQSSDSDSDFEKRPKASQSSKKTPKKTPTKGRQSKGRSSKGGKSQSKDDDSGKKQLTCSGFDYWVEVYLKDEDRWTCADVPSKKVDSTKEILAKATQPVCYVIAYNVDGTLKDVTKRYSPRFSQVTSKLRVPSDWWDESLKPFLPKHSAREAAEDSEMNLVELDMPMPKNVAECKNHPLYVLERHLLKYEAIYPPDSPSLGFVRSEPLYARQNVYTLHSREMWMKEGKVVRLGEKPYKMVKPRPKWDKVNRKIITINMLPPLEVFGPWQVEDYIPPPAVDGKVPRNAYGNVELFKPTMLPKGTVHLQVPSLNRIAKKLQIDCAPAVVGFDFHSGGCHPTYDGFVVCEEFVDVLMDAWNKDIDESAKRREEKHEKRIYGNWRRLIKGLLIREALKARYDFKGDGGDQPGSSQPSVNAEALQAARIAPEEGPMLCLFPKLMANIRAHKGRQRKAAPKDKKNPPKGKNAKQAQKGKRGRKRTVETSEEEASDWDSTSTEEDDVNMVLLSDEDSGSEFEDLKR